MRLCLRVPTNTRCFSSSAALQLPWLKSYNPELKHSGYCVSTQVLQSKVCDGYGRFAMEFIPKGMKIALIPLVFVKDIQESNMDITGDICFMMKSRNELEFMITRYSNEANVSLEEVRVGIGNFMGSWSEEGLCHFHSNCMCWNHSLVGEPNCTMHYDFTSNCAVGYSLCDINIDEELFEDYGNFTFPQWYVDWCEDHQITNVHNWLDTMCHPKEI